jgi:hypothetical protein
MKRSSEWRVSGIHEGRLLAQAVWKRKKLRSAMCFAVFGLVILLWGVKASIYFQR